MYLPIPLTHERRVQSEATPVLKTRAPYCHHHRSASADSTEYWIWNGPDHDNLNEDEDVQEDDNTEETISSINSPPGVCNSNPSLLSRPEQDASFYDAPSFDKQCSDSGSSDEGCSFSSDLPSESFSPLLRQSRQALELAYSSSSPSGSDSPLGGLGFFNLTRNGDASRPFDGLGIVRVRSGHQRVEEEGQEDEGELSPRFLRDLEAYFLVKDFGEPSFDAAMETPTIRVEDSPRDVVTPTMEEQLVAPPATPVTPSPSRSSSLTSKIKQALRPRDASAPMATSVLPRSLTTSALPTSISTASSTTVSASTSTSSTTSGSSTSSFIRKTCSAFRSQYSLNALRAEHATKTGSPGKNANTSTSPAKRTRRSGACSPNKSDDSKRTGLSSFLQPVDRASQPVPLIGQTRKVSVSVSMGEGVAPVTPRTPMKSGGKRSLQTHSVRDSKDWKDVRDLSAVGTISSGLKKRERKDH